MGTQVGRFYELYDEQAEWASRFLGLRLLAQGRGFDCRCGVPLRGESQAHGRVLAAG